MDVMTLLFYLLLQISSFPRGFGLDNCTDLERHTTLERNGGYIGCYDLGSLNLEHNISFPENIGATPESCSRGCRDRGFILAYIYQGSGCSCSSDGECLEKHVEDFRCGLPCRQDFNEFCGGLNYSAVYKVRSPNVSRSNNTDGPVQTDDVTSPNVSRSNTTKGTKQTDNVRSPTLSGSNILDGPKQTDDGSDDKPHYNTTFVLSVVISCLIICALAIAVVVFYRRLRNTTRQRTGIQHVGRTMWIMETSTITK